MRIEGTGSMQGGMMAPAADSVSKNIRAQIMNAQKQLQELAANKDMEPEEKMERRKEIQQRIADLNQQLRQHEMEVRQEKQQQVKQAEKNAQAAEKKPEKVQENKAAGLSQGSMEAMISAECATKQAEVQGSVASAMKARAGVLKSEIEHAGRGAAVERKKESVAEIEAKVEDIAKSQAQSLNVANEELKKAGEKDRAQNRAEKEKMDGEEKGEKTQDAGAGQVGMPKDGQNVAVTKKSAPNTGNVDESSKKAAKEKEREEAQEALQADMPVYRRVDILL